MTASLVIPVDDLVGIRLVVPVSLVQANLAIPRGGRSVFKRKSGHRTRAREAVSLVHSLVHWEVEGKKTSVRRAQSSFSGTPY